MYKTFFTNQFDKKLINSDKRGNIMDSNTQRAWAQISLDAIASNFKNIRKITSKNAKIMAVIKADAYGHGVFQIAKTLLENGADAFAVAILDEAKQLRRLGFDVPILILGNTNREFCDELIEYNVMPTVSSYDMAKAMSDAAQKKNTTAKIHIKLDTGMSRLGFVCDEKNASATIEKIKKIASLPNIEIDGIFTHLSCADEDEDEYTFMQYERFMKICDALMQSGVHIGKRHICNSAAIVLYPHMHLDMVRLGIVLYGLHPSPRTEGKIALEGAMSIKARVTFVKNIEEKIGVGYGKEYITNTPVTLATIPIGYADGYSRLLAKKASMLHNGKKLSVVGRICMDQCMIDATNADNINVDDVVTIIGKDGDECISAAELATQMGTINYEIVCIVGKRMPRVYTVGDSVVDVLNSLA